MLIYFGLFVYFVSMMIMLYVLMLACSPPPVDKNQPLH